MTIAVRQTYHADHTLSPVHGRGRLSMGVCLWTRWPGTDQAANAYEQCSLDGTPMPSGRRLHLDAEATSAAPESCPACGEVDHTYGECML